MSSEPAAELRGLSCGRGGVARVEGLSLALPRGSFTAVVGPSGVGKSTLLATIAGLEPPLAGEIRRASPAPTATALVPQDLKLALSLTLLTNVLTGALGRYAGWYTVGLLPPEEKAAALDLLERFGIAALARRPMATLSGGERQRGAVARALRQCPTLLLADEPVSQLDQESARRILDVLREQADRGLVTVVAVLHDRAEAFELADQVLTLDARLPGGWALLPGGRARQ